MTDARDLERAWRALVSRHLRAAELLCEDLPEVAFFHVCHAFECFCCAELLQAIPGGAVPEGHRDRVEQFLDICDDAGTKSEMEELWALLDHRNETLYPGWRRGSVREPRHGFTAARTRRVLERVRSLVT